MPAGVEWCRSNNVWIDTIGNITHTVAVLQLGDARDRPRL